MIEALAERSNKKALSPNTVKRLFADFRHFLNWALERGYLDKLPAFPKISVVKNRRPHFDRNDYRRLTRYLREFVKEAPVSVERDRALLRDYVLILANSGLRTGEARHLKWRDIRPFKSADGADNIAITVRGKTGQREVVTQPAAKDWFQRIYERRKQDLVDPSSDLFNAKAIPPDSYVFCGKNGKPIGSFKKSFNSLLRRADVEFDSFGNKRTLYSLRHTFATFRLQEGVNQYLVARNMGTSVAMLEEFSGHTSNVLAADELTKITRGRGGGAGGSTSSGLDRLEG